MDKRLVVFLAVAFGLSWPIWIVAGWLTGAATNGISTSNTMVAIVAASMFLPLIAALAANATVLPKDRIDLRLKPRLRENARFYALAWFVPAALSLAGSALFFLVFSRLFDSHATQLRALLEASGVPSEQLWPVLAGQLLASITIGPLVNALPSLGEEVGWRGMLFPLLCERMPQRQAVLASGVIWGMWHAPIIAMGHNYGTTYFGFPVTGILTMVVACTVMGCLLSWLRVKTGSVWPCAIAHGALNAIANLGIYFSLAGATLAGPSPLGLVGVLPAAALAAACWRQLSAVEPAA